MGVSSFPFEGIFPFGSFFIFGSFSIKVTVAITAKFGSYKDNSKLRWGTVGGTVKLDLFELFCTHLNVSNPEKPINSRGFNSD